MQLPISFLDTLTNAKGFIKESFVAAHNSNQQITTIRYNPNKNNQQKIGYVQQQQIPWSTYGYYLNERPSFTLDPSFHAGAYYVQEASSMFLEQVLKQTVNLSKEIKILDLCAAPGGKSTLIQSLINTDSILVSNEIIKNRVNILTENIIKWGAANVIVTNNEPKDFKRLKNYFDVIVVDAPCSGSGLFRKDEKAIAEWSLNNVKLCNQRQQRILFDIIDSLKEDGVLIYSTCSYSKEENEEVCDWLIKQFKFKSLQLKVQTDWNIVETISEKQNAYGYRFYPDKLKGEGFFIAAFKKLGNKILESPTQPQKLKTENTKLIIATIHAWIKKPSNFFFIMQNDEIIAIPINLQNDFKIIQSTLYIKKAGIRLGGIIRNELIPHHELALSTILNDTIPCIDVNIEIALQYLRKHEIKIKTTSKGWALLRYQNLALGWIKILSNRINNYYPKEFRILNK